MKKKLEYLKSEYHQCDVCMDEMLNDLSADGLTIGEAFDVYVAAMNWANGDRFFVRCGCLEGLESEIKVEL